MTARFPLESLATPGLPRLVPDGVFDAFGWCPSERLTWGRAADRAFDTERAIMSANPSDMVFVFHSHDAAPYLPRELAALHAAGMGFVDEMALAPWAIDDATDLLFEHRARPADCLWLVAQSLASLFWGLHDWAHFHNHGPFERRAWTELQCDVSALGWLDMNRGVVGIDEAQWERARREVVEVARARFGEEEEAKEETGRGDRFDASLLDADAIRGALSARAAR